MPVINIALKRTCYVIKYLLFSTIQCLGFVFIIYVSILFCPLEFCPTKGFQEEENDLRNT